MSVENLLARLGKVRQVGPGRWTAICPAHEDRSPSLSIREMSDGRALVHCFTGCAVNAILTAVGLTFSELYPEKPLGAPYTKPERPPFPALDVLRAVAHEALIVDCAAGTIQRRGWLNDSECERLVIARDRLQAAAALVEARRHG